MNVALRESLDEADASDNMFDIVLSNRSEGQGRHVSLHICARVASVAEGCASTWSSAVAAVCRQWGIPVIRQWLEPDSHEHKSKAPVKRITKPYIDQAVWPAAEVHEITWREVEDAKHPLTGTMVMKDIVDVVPSPNH